jgi:hypothetical protein
MVFFRVDLFMLLEILRPFEGLVAYLAYVGLEGGMHTKVTGYVITLGTGGPAILPLASETEIVGAFAANVIVAQMSVEGLRIGIVELAVDPLALVGELGVW